MEVRVVPKRSRQVVLVEYVLVDRHVLGAQVYEYVVTRRFSGNMGAVGVNVCSVRSGVVVLPESFVRPVGSSLTVDKFELHSSTRLKMKSWSTEVRFDTIRGE